MRDEYRAQVALLIETIPFVAREDCFALKGGTAINLFYLNLPRLSVDIDLVYTGFEERESAYEAINAALERIAISLGRSGLTATLQGAESEKKLIVSNRKASIKVEPNYTIRGHIYEPELKSICGKAEAEYAYAEMRVISLPELFGGKICAALDRQHPRDLFDIGGLLSGGFDLDAVIKGFIAMLLSHNRPIHELLDPVFQDRHEVFEKEFHGMTDSEWFYEDQRRMFEMLVQLIKSKIVPYREFLLDFVSLHPDFHGVSIPNLEKLPAVQWKLKNLEQLRDRNPDKFRSQYDKLLNYFL